MPSGLVRGLNDQGAERRALFLYKGQMDSSVLKPGQNGQLGCENRTERTWVLSRGRFLLTAKVDRALQLIGEIKSAAYSHLIPTPARTEKLTWSGSFSCSFVFNPFVLSVMSVCTCLHCCRCVCLSVGGYYQPVSMSAYFPTSACLLMSFLSPVCAMRGCFPGGRPEGAAEPLQPRRAPHGDARLVPPAVSQGESGE